MKIKLLEKIIKYRLSYSGTKETDLLYKKFFLDNIENYSEKDLILLKNMFDICSDDQIYSYLTKEEKPPLKYRNLIIKSLNEK